MLELSFVAGTSQSVLGRDFLFNEKSNKKVFLPVWDSSDMTYLAARLKIKFAHKQVVLGDESHDLDDPQVAPLVALGRPDSPRSPKPPPAPSPRQTLRAPVSPEQAMLVRSMILAGSHFLGVDDPGQWVYGCRGARREAYLELVEDAVCLTISVPSI